MVGQAMGSVEDLGDDFLPYCEGVVDPKSCQTKKGREDGYVSPMQEIPLTDEVESR